MWLDRRIVWLFHSELTKANVTTPKQALFSIPDTKIWFCFQNPHELGPDGRVVYEKKEQPTSK